MFNVFVTFHIPSSLSATRVFLDLPRKRSAQRESGSPELNWAVEVWIYAVNHKLNQLSDNLVNACISGLTGFAYYKVT